MEKKRCTIHIHVKIGGFLNNLCVSGTYKIKDLLIKSGSETRATLASPQNRTGWSGVQNIVVICEILPRHRGQFGMT